MAGCDDQTHGPFIVLRRMQNVVEHVTGNYKCVIFVFSELVSQLGVMPAALLHTGVVLSV